MVRLAHHEQRDELDTIPVRGEPEPALSKGTMNPAQAA